MFVIAFKGIYSYANQEKEAHCTVRSDDKLYVSQDERQCLSASSTSEVRRLRATILDDNARLELQPGQFDLGHLKLGRSASLSIGMLSKIWAVATLSENAVVDVMFSVLEFRNNSAFTANSRLQLQGTVVDFPDTVQFDLPGSQVMLTDGSQIHFDGLLVLVVRAVPSKSSATFWLKDEAVAEFNDTGVEVRVEPTQYLPQDYPVTIISASPSGHQVKGRARLINSQTP